MKMKTINLDGIDGFEFEKVTAEIFHNLRFGRVEITPPVGDAGKDIIIHTNQGKIIIECKHYPRTPVGRPIIQKLHSAVISEKGIKGIVVTTGKFSQNAIEHAKKLHPPIELIDFGILNDMAIKANIDLVTSSKKSKIYSFPLSDSKTIKRNLAAHMNTRLKSYPYGLINIVQLTQIHTKLTPLYDIKYTINADFSTSVGRIHTESAQSGFFISGKTGQLFPENITQYFNNTPMNEIIPHNLPNSIQIESFDHRINEIKNWAINYIIKKHTKIVQYRGRNNIGYSKECMPKKKDIYISDISQIYLPEIQIQFKLCGKNRFFSIADNQTSNFYVYNNNISVCEVCGNDLTKKGLLCNECGDISHDQSFFRSHGFYCKHCGKSLCRKCSSYYRKYLFFKVPICIQCSKSEIVKNKKIKGFNPI